MGNTSYSKIAGIRDICLKTNVGCTLVLKDVRHVPDLRMNLISGVALDRMDMRTNLQIKNGDPPKGHW